MRTKYYNDGIIGNQKVTVSFTEKGELLRLFFDSVDYKQLIDTYHIAIKVNDSAGIYLHDDVNNIYHQEYVKDTNILKTEVINTYFNVGVTEYAFVPLDENMLIRTFKVKNNSKNDLNISLLAYSKLLTNINNDSCGLVKNDKHRTSNILYNDKLYDIDKTSNLFHMLERIQDEVHNYTISYHKQIRSKGSLESILDNIEGIGDIRKKKLLKKYKTINKMKEATLEDLEEILSDKVAKNFYDFIQSYEVK